MTECALRTHNFRISYGPGDDRLHDFYIPALKASVRYERMTGYFSSHALAIAAAGVAHLIANGGTMRLLVGAQLSREDVAAIKVGEDVQDRVAATFARALPSPAAIEHEHLRERLAALAWLVAIGRLEIRVVLPKGPGGLPLPAPEARDYFHPKVGIFTDAKGNQVAFSGSINESATGWAHNYEQFMVFTSWESGPQYVAEAVGRFARLWEQREPDWLSLPVPEAVRAQLLRYTPAQAPTRDPLEKPPRQVKDTVKKLILAPELAQERVLCQFLRDAPFLVGTTGLGAATCAVTPWPHQQTVAQQVVATYPDRYLFCDEVGLGKTIEAGLVLRALWLRGIVRRALILAPKSVLRQWQEELYEKFALDVPVYDGKVFRTLDSAIQTVSTANPWDGVDMALASSQLVKRRDRQQELLQAQPWDLILVDEAHHARRKDFLNKNTYRPNRLLELLNRLHARTRGLLLMTATPMQVDPIEVWDLLNLLGLHGIWGADGRNFLRFYEELRAAQLEHEDVQWGFVLRMFRAELAARGGVLDPTAVAYGQETLGIVAWTQLKQLLKDAPLRTPAMKGQFAKLPETTQRVAVEVIKQHTPLRRLVFRNTRPLLRDYQQRGLLQDTVPVREPRPQWIAMQPDERALYQRIEEYISDFYRKYEAQRKGLGFVMTVYRRRLTSSFYAIRRSLERRLAFLQGMGDLGLEDDDIEQEALSLDMDETLTSETGQEEARAYRQEEIAYVEDFLHSLRALGHHDAKVTQLLADLAELFRHRDTVLIFTQYTDTMDFLRERLRAQYGDQVACYSGRGGEWWDGNTWVTITKEELKNDFREGQRVKILLATDAASEGLNLQSCGVLINYDMPWNPMRVEQRIGRVDRIGQRYDTVWIYNYFYKDTVEALVYEALSTRIDWFQHVVGPLQPILAQVGRAIQNAAMAVGPEQAQTLNAELAAIESALDNAQDNLDLDALSAQAREATGWPSPVALGELAATLLTSPTLSTYFHPHPTIAGAFWLTLDGEKHPVTFDRAVFDTYPNTLHLLTYGTSWLEHLLAAVEGPGEKSPGPVLRLSVDSPFPRVAYYRLDPTGHPQRLATLNELRQALSTQPPVTWGAEQVTTAQQDLQMAVKEEQAHIRRGQARLRDAQWETLVARARRLLLDAALVELALGQQPHLLEEQTYPQSFNEHAVLGLRRHNYPWAPLLKLVGQAATNWTPSPTDPFFLEVQGEAPPKLKQRFARLTQSAKHLLDLLATMKSEKRG